MGFDYIIDGNIFVDGRVQSCCFGVENGKIISVKKILTGAHVKKFPKQIIIPAGIDIHVHFRDPGFPQKETFQTGSLAAAFGGIGCVFDMPNTQPQTTNKEEIINKIEYARRQSLVDFGIYAGVTDDNIGILHEIMPLVPGFKVFLGETTNSLVFAKDHLPILFQALRHSSKPVLFHTEDRDCLKSHHASESNLLDHHNNRPCGCEEKAISMILSNAPFFCPIHICHISSKSSLNLLLARKERVSFGVTPHHCLLHIENKIEPSSQPFFKVNPPLRPAVEQSHLFQRLTRGDIPIIESDHAPHTTHEKSQEFSKAPSGIIGVETMYPLFLYLASNQNISFSRVISAVCEHPSKLFHLKKGFIKEGFDADFITIDMKKPQMISSDILHSKQTHSPFEKRHGIFPTHVFLRGQPVIEDGILVAKSGRGAHVVIFDRES